MYEEKGETLYKMHKIPKQIPRQFVQSASLKKIKKTFKKVIDNPFKSGKMVVYSNECNALFGGSSPSTRIGNLAKY
jgi:hypothetical protein